MLATADAPFRLACDAAALDENNQPLSEPTIRFMAEAGVVRRLESSTEGPGYVYEPLAGESLEPKNVSPFPGEPTS